MTKNRTFVVKPTISGANVSIVSTIVNYALHHGLTLDQISTATGIRGEELADPNARPPEAAVPAIWNLMIEHAPSEDSLTMKMAEAAPLTFFSDIAHAVQFTSTIGEAVELLAHYRRILSDQVDVNVVASGDETSLIVTHPLDEVDSGRMSELGIALAWRMLKQLAAEPIALKRIELAHAPTGAAGGYRRVFGLDPQFQMPHTALVLSKDALNRPVRGGGSELLGYVRSHLSNMLNKLDTATETHPLDPLRRAVLQTSKRGEFGARLVAKQAGLGYRQAQRTAAANGTTLRALIEENRLAIATDFLSESGRTIEEIALALGYADDRAFRRAFKRRHKMSPSEYRRKKYS